MKEKKTFSSQEWLLVLTAVYTTIAVTMNIFCMKSLSFGTGIIICDAGLLVSWGVFLTSNVIVEVWDEETSIKVVNVAAVITFFALVLGRIIVFIPTLPDYEDQASAFAQIFSNGPRTILSSITAFYLGNLINVKIIARMKRWIEEKRKDNGLHFFSRASFSTLIGQLADNFIFMILAFAPIGLSVYEMAWFDILTAVLSGTVIELVVEATLVPFITIPLVKHIKAIREKEEK